MYYHFNGRCYQQRVGERFFSPHLKQLKLLIFLKACFKSQHFIIICIFAFRVYFYDNRLLVLCTFPEFASNSSSDWKCSMQMRNREWQSKTTRNTYRGYKSGSKTLQSQRSQKLALYNPELYAFKWGTTPSNMVNTILIAVLTTLRVIFTCSEHPITEGVLSIEIAEEFRAS